MHDNTNSDLSNRSFLCTCISGVIIFTALSFIYALGLYKAYK